MVLWRKTPYGWQCNYRALPTPAMMTISKTSEHDLRVEKEMLADTVNIRFFGDTAFADKDLAITYAAGKQC